MSVARSSGPEEAAAWSKAPGLAASQATPRRSSSARVRVQPSFVVGAPFMRISFTTPPAWSLTSRIFASWSGFSTKQTRAPESARM